MTAILADTIHKLPRRSQPGGRKKRKAAAAASPAKAVVPPGASWTVDRDRITLPKLKFMERPE